MLVKTFMTTAIHQTQEKSPRFSAMMLEVDFPTKDPICSFSSVERLLGTKHTQYLQQELERQERRRIPFQWQVPGQVSMQSHVQEGTKMRRFCIEQPVLRCLQARERLDRRSGIGSCELLSLPLRRWIRWCRSHFRTGLPLHYILVWVPNDNCSRKETHTSTSDSVGNNTARKDQGSFHKVLACV